jgi:hypothetical protein
MLELNKLLAYQQITTHFTCPLDLRLTKRLRWSRGTVLFFGTQIRRFKPGRSSRIFQGEKILSTPSFGGEVKAVMSHVADLRHVKEH